MDELPGPDPLAWVVARAGRGAPGPDAGLTELVDHLERVRHPVARAALAVLARQRPVLAADVAPAATTAPVPLHGIDTTVACLTAHLATDERVRFPRLRALAAGDAGAPGELFDQLRVVRLEHQRARQAVAELVAWCAVRPARAASAQVCAVAGALAAELALHADVEERALFGRALAQARAGPLAPPSAPTPSSPPAPSPVPRAPHRRR